MHCTHARGAALEPNPICTLYLKYFFTAALKVSCAFLSCMISYLDICVEFFEFSDLRIFDMHGTSARARN